MEIIGEIQNIKQDKKAFTIDNIWYNSFKPIEWLNKGDYVKVVFTTKGDFKNVKSVEIIKQDLPDQEVRRMSDTVLDTLIMQSVEYAKIRDITITESTKELINCYKLILSTV